MNNNIKRNELLHDKFSRKYDKRHYEIYNNIEQCRISDLIKYIFKLLGKSEVNALDYWSWTWNLTKHFLINWFNAYSLDISSESLSVLNQRFEKYRSKLKTIKFDWYDIPIDDNKFDLVWIYSVLHHIPDYIKAFDDISRVIKKWWFIIVDHEVNSNFWNPDDNLKEYNKLSNNLFKKVINLFKSWEIFEIWFWRWVYIRKFINYNYRNEGDIHVFKNDHIEWDKIKEKLNSLNFEIVKENDYLLYNVNVKDKDYKKYSSLTNNMKYIIAKKIK